MFKGYFTEKFFEIAPVHCATSLISGVRSVKFSFGWNQALSARLDVSSAAFSGLCYGFVTGGHSRGRPVTVKLALLQDCRQWRRDESKNSRASGGSSLHAFFAFLLTFMQKCVSALTPPPVEQLGTTPTLKTCNSLTY